MNLSSTKALAAPLLIAGACSLPAVWLTASPGFSAPACGVYAQTPFRSVRDVVGVGGRHHCKTKTKVKVALKWDRPLSPDPVMDDRSGTFVNIKLAPSGVCLVGTHDSYVDTSGNGSARSNPRLRLTCTAA